MTPTATSRRERLLLLLSFASIYIIWGSTYLAIRFAVESIPPLVVAGLRHLTAGSVLLAWALTRGYRPTMREVRSCLVLGALFFLIGHGTLHWAETLVPSCANRSFRASSHSLVLGLNSRSLFSLPVPRVVFRSLEYACRCVRSCSGTRSDALRSRERGSRCERT